MWPNWQETANLVTFTEKILNGKLHFTCSVISVQNVISSCYKLTFPSVHISHKFVSFLFEKQYELIYRVLVYFWARNNKDWHLPEPYIRVVISGQCYHYIETIWLIVSTDDLFTLITLFISDTTFSIYHFPLSLRHSSPLFPSFYSRHAYFSKTQQQTQTILWYLGNSSN